MKDDDVFVNSHRGTSISSKARALRSRADSLVLIFPFDESRAIELSIPASALRELASCYFRVIDDL